MRRSSPVRSIASVRNILFERTKMFRRKVFVTTAAAAAFSLLLTACGGGDNTTNTAAAVSRTLTLGSVGPAASFDASEMAFANGSPYAQAVYDTLLRADPTGKVIAGLATEWKYNADRTVLTLTLRSDVTFTDGTKFDADAAAQNLIRFRDGTNALKVNLAALKDAKVVDPTHLQLTLADSDPGLLLNLTQSAGLVESPAAFRNADVKTKPVGSGPYILDTQKTVVGSSYTFTKNPNYWDKGSQHYDNLVIKVFADPTATLNALKGRQLNVANVGNDILEQAKGAGFTAHTAEANWLGLVLFDRAGTLNPAMKDVRVRQAINYAFDTKALLTAVGKGLGTPTTQVFPKTSVAYDPALDSRYTYDPAKAKALLAEAGYPNGFTLEMPSTAVLGTATFPLITQQLKDVGITAKFTDAGPNFITDVLTPKYPATYMPLQQDPDWQLINFMIAPNAPFNPTKFQDLKVDALIKKIHDSSEADQAPALKELNAYIVEQAWFAPWFRAQGSIVTDPTTTVVLQVGNSAYPYLWNITPKS
jgi:peptide/nickel transport system substrate-binding protein